MNIFRFGLVVSTIETVYNVNQLKNLQNNLTAEGGTDYGIVYAHISQFNIDGDAPVTVIKWWVFQGLSGYNVTIN